MGSEDGDDSCVLIQTTNADEMGLTMEDITGSVNPKSLGIDSLMTILILGNLRERIGSGLPSRFFIEHPPMVDSENFLNMY
jgi:hypothetical protein